MCNISQARTEMYTNETSYSDKDNNCKYNERLEQRVSSGALNDKPRRSLEYSQTALFLLC